MQPWAGHAVRAYGGIGVSDDRATAVLATIRSMAPMILALDFWTVQVTLNGVATLFDNGHADFGQTSLTQLLFRRRE